MEKLKVAVLEDNKQLLKDLVALLQESGLIEVTGFANGSEEFGEKIKNNPPQALILDIDLTGDSMSGLDVATRYSLPVLFISGKTAENIHGIETLNLENGRIVEHLTKPVSSDKLKRLLPKFIAEIRHQHNSRFVYLDFRSSRKNRITIDNIVYLCTDKQEGAESGNKKMYFADRKPEVLIDFSFNEMDSSGLLKEKFLVTHKSFRVNADRILRYLPSHHLEMEVLDESGRKVIHRVPVSENYRRHFS